MSDANLHAADLLLASRCAAGDAEAIAILEREQFDRLDGLLERLGAPPDMASEIKQALRTRLLLPRDGKGPEIADYMGRAPLEGWLRVVAVRLAGRMLRERRASPERGDDALVELLAPGADPTLEWVKEAHRPDFSRALEEAIASLSVRERNLLRHQILDGLNVDQVGALYRVHRATAARWLVKAREHLLDAVREALMRRLGIDRAEAESLLRLVRSQVDVSVDRLLGPPEGPPEE